MLEISVKFTMAQSSLFMVAVSFAEGFGCVRNDAFGTILNLRGTAPIACWLASVYNMKGSLMLGKTKIRAEVSLAFRTSNASSDSELQRKTFDFSVS